MSEKQLLASRILKKSSASQDAGHQATQSGKGLRNSSINGTTSSVLMSWSSLWSLRCLNSQRWIWVKLVCVELNQCSSSDLLDVLPQDTSNENTLQRHSRPSPRPFGVPWSSTILQLQHFPHSGPHYPDILRLCSMLNIGRIHAYWCIARGFDGDLTVLQMMLASNIYNDEEGSSPKHILMLAESQQGSDSTGIIRRRWWVRRRTQHSAPGILLNYMSTCEPKLNTLLTPAIKDLHACCQSHCHQWQDNNLLRLNG